MVCGKVNSTNLSRYSDRSERTYRRHFEAGLGLEGLNQALIEQITAAAGVSLYTAALVPMQLCSAARFQMERFANPNCTGTKPTG